MIDKNPQNVAYCNTKYELISLKIVTTKTNA